MAGLYPTDFRVRGTDAARPLRAHCPTVRRALWALLDGELSAEDAADIATHRQVCPACELVYAARLALHRALRRVASGVMSDAAKARLRQRLAAVQGRSVPSETPTLTVRPGPGK